MQRFVVALFGLLIVAMSACAGELQLKNGLVFRGKVVGVNDIAVFAINAAANPKNNPAGCPIWLVDDGPRRLCVQAGRRQSSMTVCFRLIRGPSFISNRSGPGSRSARHRSAAFRALKSLTNMGTGWSS